MTACPSCGAQLVKIPQRKTKCKHCGKFIFSKCTPDSRQPRLMTAEQAAEAEVAWATHREDALAARDGAVFGLPFLPKAPAVRRAYNLMKMEADLAKIGRQGFHQAQIFGGDPTRCAACDRQNLKVIQVTDGAQNVVPEDCARLSAGAALCLLMVSAAIKRSDGTTYFTRS